MTDTTTDPRNAALKVRIENPSIYPCPKNQNIKPFTTIENNPNVIRFIGSVRMLIIGFTSVLMIYSIAPTISADQAGFIIIPSLTINGVANTAADKIKK